MGPVIRRFVAFAILFVVLGVLEGLFAARRDQRRFRKGWKTDVLHFAFTEALTQVGLVLAILPLALLVHFLAPVGPRLWVQALPGGVQVLLAVVLIDFLGYWRHRLAHTVPFLWRIHAVHHSSEHMDWLAAVRVHPLDTVIARSVVFVPLFALGFSEQTFGGSLGLLKGVGLLFHCNVHWTYGPLKKWIASPAFHHWHHAREPIDKNFSGLLPVWDLLFGTYHLPEELPAQYGTRRPVPEGYLAQLMHPFRGSAPEPGAAPAEALAPGVAAAAA